MVKSILIAAAFSLAFGGAALAQATVTGAPAGQMPDTQEPHGSGAAGMPHAHTMSHHAYRRHHVRRATAPAASGSTQP